MKNLGMVRKLDDLGRITLPKELRKTLGIKEKDPVEIFVYGDAICLKAVPKVVCAICGNHDTGMIKINDRHICLNCLDLVYEEVKKIGRN